MKLSIDRENLLPCLQQLSGVIEKKQTFPILSNILLQATDNKLFLTGTDTEIQIITNILVSSEVDGEITVPAKKILDICRLSNKGSLITCEEKDGKFIVRSDKSRFSLATLPAEHYPAFDQHNYQPLFTIRSSEFKKILEKTIFSMALQDVRFFLNGLMLQFENMNLDVIASDGHRLAVYKQTLESSAKDNVKIVIPRKGVLELFRLLDDGEEDMMFEVSQSSVKISYSNFEFSAKLIEGRLPDYKKAIPTDLQKTLFIEHDVFKSALSRIAILTNDEYRGVNFDIEEDLMTINHRNPEHEEGEEKIKIDYQGDSLSMGMNVTYVQDAVSHIDSNQVKISFTDASQACLFEDTENEKYKFIIMPMRV